MSEQVDWGESADIKDQTVSYFVRGMKTLWKLAFSEKKRIATAIVFLIVCTAMDLSFPLIFKQLVDYLPTVLEKGITSYVLWLVAIMFGFRVMLLFIRRFVQEPIFLKSIINLENLWPQEAYQKLLGLSIGYHQQENTGKKIAKVNKGVEKMVGMLADMFWGILPSAFYLLLNIPIMIYLDWKLGLLFVLPLIPYVLINLKSYEKFYDKWEKWEEMKEKAVGLFCQSIINIRTIQSYVCEEREAKNHGGIRKEMETLDIVTALKLQYYFFFMELILGICFIGTIVAGLYFISIGASTIGTVAYVFITGNAALQNLWGMIHIYTRMLRNLTAAYRMQTLLEEEADVANEAKGSIIKKLIGMLSVIGLRLIYPNKTNSSVDIPELEIPPGQMVAFVGKTGSGKSSVIDLLTRIIDPTEGMVLLDSKNVRELDRDWYRKQFAVVPQEVEIIEGTILSNIKLANPDAPKAFIDQAVEASCLSEIVEDKERFPDGLETLVGERGIRLSGGERQRVGIARAYVALLSGARFLVLDEATSSLDTETERVVQDFINRLRQTQNTTIIAIAHRLSTIYNSDRIIVLREGKIIEDGTHDQLIQENGLYAKLVELQEMKQIS